MLGKNVRRDQNILNGKMMIFDEFTELMLMVLLSDKLGIMIALEIIQDMILNNELIKSLVFGSRSIKP